MLFLLIPLGFLMYFFFLAGKDCFEYGDIEEAVKYIFTGICGAIGLFCLVAMLLIMSGEIYYYYHSSEIDLPFTEVTTPLDVNLLTEVPIVISSEGVTYYTENPNLPGNGVEHIVKVENCAFIYDDTKEPCVTKKSGSKLDFWTYYNATYYIFTVPNEQYVTRGERVIYVS